MSFGSFTAQPGMEVCACDAEPLGRVIEVRVDGLLVEAPKGNTTIFVPRDAIAEVSESERRVDLRLTAEELTTHASGGAPA